MLALRWIDYDEGACTLAVNGNVIRVAGKGLKRVDDTRSAAGRRVVPELLQDRFTAKDVATALAPLLADTPERQQMIADLAEVRHILRPDLNSSSIQRVCEGVEELLSRRTPAGGLNVTASV